MICLPKSRQFFRFAVAMVMLPAAFTATLAIAVTAVTAATALVTIFNRSVIPLTDSSFSSGCLDTEACRRDRRSCRPRWGTCNRMWSLARSWLALSNRWWSSSSSPRWWSSRNSLAGNEMRVRQNSTSFTRSFTSVSNTVVSNQTVTLLIWQIFRGSFEIREGLGTTQCNIYENRVNFQQLEEPVHCLKESAISLSLPKAHSDLPLK